VAAKGDSAAVFDDWLIILVHIANPKILSYATPRGKVVSRRFCRVGAGWAANVTTPG
jgi:hypothetical protein